MSIPALFRQTVVSLEVFPPKPDAPVDMIHQTLVQLSHLKPDYMSVTYGAGGSRAGQTLEIARDIPSLCGCPALGHLTCVGADVASIRQSLAQFQQAGVQAILALRGDVPAGMDPQTAFRHMPYASELVKEIAAFGGFSIAAACYPESHYQSDSQRDDLLYLKRKVDCGVDWLVSQLFFDNDAFFSFVDRARRIGIRVPITAGIMPVLNAKQILRMTTLCGASIPASLSRIIARYGEDPVSFAEAGMDFCCAQIADLLKGGVDGIHLYSMNRAKSATAILQRTGLRD